MNAEDEFECWYAVDSYDLDRGMTRIMVTKDWRRASEYAANRASGLCDTFPGDYAYPYGPEMQGETFAKFYRCVNIDWESVQEFFAQHPELA